MRRLWLAIAGALALAGCQEPKSTGPAPSPALWEVTGPGGERGWLFGTIHALPDGTPWETPALVTALDQAGVLVVEVANLGDPAAANSAFQALSQSPGLPPLMQRLPAPQRPALAQALKRADIAEADLRRTETWAAALLIANGQRSADIGNGVDRVLLRRGMPALALEGFAEQFAIFDALTPQDQADLLYLATVETDRAEEERATRAWLRGDLAALEREGLEDVLADPELRQALLVERNQAWVERIVPLLKQGRRPFVAVGAGHMLGEVGLPAMLSAQGYTVRRVQ